jgi:hypothetical protein
MSTNPPSPYVRGSILDRLSKLTVRESKKYQELREQGMTIKEALNTIKPLVFITKAQLTLDPNREDKE